MFHRLALALLVLVPLACAGGPQPGTAPDTSAPAPSPTPSPTPAPTAPIESTESAPAFPFPVHDTTLDNGLRVLVIPFDSPGIVAYFSVVRTGSRDEVEAGHSGFAHFFEHMMFRGTPRYSEDDYNDVLKRLGVDSNAFTTDDYTAYHIIGPSAELETMMDIESDRFRNLEYDEEAFKTEALAVLGEYNKNASSPFLPMYERMRELAFSEHTYAHTTLGYLDDIRAMPTYYDYSLGFFDRFYRPENTILLIVGDVDPKATVAMAERFYGPWKAGYQAPAVAPEPAPRGPHEATLDWPSPTRPQLMMGWRRPAFDTDTVDTAALHLLGQLLFADNAPLYQKLVVEEQWVDSLDAYEEDRRDPYLYTVYSQVKSEDLLPKVEGAIEQAVGRLQAEPVSAERLERIKEHLFYDFALGLDSPGSVGFTVADYLSWTGEIGSINELFERYREVEPEDIQRLARQVFRAENRTAVRLRHPADGDQADQMDQSDQEAGR